MGRADHLAAVFAEPRVGSPRGDQGFEQGRLAGAGDAGEHREAAALAQRVDGGPLLLCEGDAAVGDRLLDRPDRQRAGHVAGSGLRTFGQALLDADLRGVRDPHFLVEETHHQGDVLALEPDAPFFE